MSINITAAGATGNHYLTRTNVNLDENTIYYSGRNANSTYPTNLQDDGAFIYSNGLGSLGGITADSLVYINKIDNYSLAVSDTLNGTSIDLTSSMAGTVFFNEPSVYANKLNLRTDFTTGQAVRYTTGGTPITGLTNGAKYYVNKGTGGLLGASSLYPFTSHTFTTAGATQANGPTIGQARSAYAAQSWSSTYLNMNGPQGYQQWTVPTTGTYRLIARGGSGGDYNTDAGNGGYGAQMEGTFSLTQNDVLTIVVGQRGFRSESGGQAAPGGGGSFVFKSASAYTTGTCLLAAGGGGGTATGWIGRPGNTYASLNTNGNNASNGIEGGVWGAGGSNGNGGNGGISAGGQGGAGISSNGGQPSAGAAGEPAQAISTNARGGYNQYNHRGGFGGGGGYWGGGGAGGGYSGGGGGNWSSGYAGGGGGSYNTGTSQNNFVYTAAFGDGIVTATLTQAGGGEAYTLHATVADALAGTNPIAISPAGGSEHALVPLSLDLETDTIHYTSAHGFVDGQAVSYLPASTFAGGMTNTLTYYVDVIDDYTVKLSTTQSPSFTYVNFTSYASAVDRLGKVTVDLTLNMLNITSHGFLENQPIQYQTNGGTPIVPLQNSATYYVKQVVDNNRVTLSQSLGGPVIDLTGTGTGTTHSFRFVTVNLVEDTFYIPGHSLATGQKVQYLAGSGTPIGGLTSGTEYFVYKIDNNTIKLSTNRAGTAIMNLSSLGTGTQSLVIRPISVADNTISVPNHGFSTNELVQYDSSGQTVIGGLTSGSTYYIIAVDGDTFKLATTLENSNTGTAVDISSLGVGTHKLISLTKSPDGIYTIVNVPSPTTFELTANGLVPPIVKVVQPRYVVNTQNNNLFILGHGFSTGTKLTYTLPNGGTAIGGLTANSDFYAIVVNRDYIRLASSAEDASSGVALSLTNFGSGSDHTFTTTQINGNVNGSGSISTIADSTLINGNGTSFSKVLKVGDALRIYPPNADVVKTFAASNVAVSPTNRITVTGHTFTTGDVVKYSAGSGGVAPSGMNDGYMYYVRAVDANTLKLYNSASDASADSGAVTISSQGTGTAMTFSKSVPTSPIVRRITAIGSDTQVTVDRAFSVAYGGIGYSYGTFVYVRPQGYNLHRPFDGGVEMSVGAGVSNAQIIRQTRKYFRYQSGKGIQTSFAINFKPTIDLNKLFKVSDVTIQGQTRRPHGLINGLNIKITDALTSTGVDSTVFNGTFQVTVIDDFNFTIIASSTVPDAPENMAYGFPQFHVTDWENGAVRAGMFDFQNGMFYEFDGQQLYAVRRSSTQQIAGTASALQGSDLVFGTNTSFTAQLSDGDMIVMRGQSYRVASVISDTRIAIKPEYKGSSGTEKEFTPGNGSTGVVRVSTDQFVIQNHGFTENLPVVYNSIDGTPIGGLISGRTYYVVYIDNNTFQLRSLPDAEQVVSISSAGAGDPHSFTPAKSGIIITKTVDVKTPQSEFSIDPCDGTGPTGFNLDLSRIQMCYMDYSWYGAGKIRYGFKTKEGEVQYVHEYIHNNQLLESYFRSGNLPARYEVVTYEGPTYVPSLFHWGTSVIMDGRFDDDKSYLFTQSGQTLTIAGTTVKRFASSAINVATDTVTIPSHGFSSGDGVVFRGIAATGRTGTNNNNPAYTNTTTYLTNGTTYYIRKTGNDTLVFHSTQVDALAGTNTLNITTVGSAQYTFEISPTGTSNNSSGAAYQPLLSLRLSPSVSSGLPGKLGDRDIINRMQLRLKELSIQTDQLVDVKLLINGRLNNLNFSNVGAPSLTQTIQHTSNDTISGGVQIYNLRAAGANGTEVSTVVDIDALFELSNSILGGDSIFPDGPDIVTIAVARLSGNTTKASAKLTWTEAQA